MHTDNAGNVILLICQRPLSGWQTDAGQEWYRHHQSQAAGQDEIIEWHD